MAAAVDDEGFAVGSFDPSPIDRLAQLLQEQDAAELRRRLRDELGVQDESFATALVKSHKICCRGSLLYPASSELAVSFNGGKDACVVLYLWMAAVAAAASANGVEPPQAIFFDSSSEFPCIQSFVAWVVRSLGLRMVTLEQCSFRQGMEDLVSRGVRAVVMGQRRGDPWMADVNAFSPSTDGWPAFMRINPIIDWSYSDVWTFLRVFKLPYCALYDQGYTSLGNVSNTLRNPSLLRPDGSYAPAYELQDANLERAGRISGSNSRKEQKASPVCPRLSSSAQPRTAGVVVIGNEILNGKVHDANANYLCEELHSRGVAVTCVEVVPDSIEAIASSTKRLSEACEFVFTSGGLGPTHDDISMEGVAAAFGASLDVDERFLAMLSSRGFSSESASRKMAHVPKGSKIEWLEDGNPWPLVSMRNVYIFAGMPSVFKAMFQRASADGRFNGTHLWASCMLKLDAEEVGILERLQETVDKFPKVTIGSYPSTVAPVDGVSVEGSGDEHVGINGKQSRSWRCRLSITFESFDPEEAQAARAHLAAVVERRMLSPEDLQE
eukprot:CAMPEP_0197895334 /NCGR_PEP_ID=MMETSP1439-20131203/37029_1 /TAXON_ID=66791 /ORGANISM="Gonyaulax spinifera, Strain CCMP409" /LENGTH=552 /DNA_ID=CAMNT_0043515761 /DNA_START=61 /DNA_END=1719 /DNA_ORIENTATION=-